ncbi:oxidoreductase [Bryobacterales bacterium F-183]|nr:oxidoreductase [Bryobacterales bacterium F-183]
MTNNNDFVRGKVVLITGASSGIGEATARLLASRGATVVLGARRTDRLEQIVSDIRSTGGTADARKLDVADRADTAAFVQFAIEKYGRVDVLFNNAGVMPLSPLSALKVDEWDNMLNVNVRGVLNGIAAALPLMEAQGGGQIINNASVAAHWVGPTAAVYSATKYAVRIISEGLRSETQKVRVSVVSPGVTETELGHDISDDATKGFLTELRKNSLAADDIARAVVYAIDQPPHVDVNEIIVRPIVSPL